MYTTWGILMCQLVECMAHVHTIYSRVPNVKIEVPPMGSLTDYCGMFILLILAQRHDKTHAFAFCCVGLHCLKFQIEKVH